MNAKFVVQFCVPPTYHHLAAELYYGDEHWAELNTEHDRLQLVVFPRSSGEAWMLSASDALDALHCAESELKERSLFFETRE